MTSQLEDLSQILYLCMDACAATLVYKHHFNHLKRAIDIVLPLISSDALDIVDTDDLIGISQRSVDIFEVIHNLLCQCGNEDEMMHVLSNYADNSSTILNSLNNLVEISIAYSLNVQIDHFVNRWTMFKLQLNDWKEAIELLEVVVDTLTEDPHHNQADRSSVQEVRKKVIFQYPEPDIFPRMSSVDISQFQSFNEPLLNDEGDEDDVCPAAGSTSFAIYSASSGAIPLAVKTIPYVNLKNSASSAKEIADLYLQSDSMSSPLVHSLLKVQFDGDDAVNMLFSLPTVGNLKSMITMFGKNRRRTVGEPGTHEAWLAERGRVEGKLSVMNDVVAGLIFLHAKGIVHGRLKPSNVLIYDGYRARVADFGISPFLKVSSKTAAWLQAGKAALAGSLPPADSTAVPYNEFRIGEGGVRWLAPELLLIPTPPINCETVISAPSNYYGDLSCPRYTSDIYAAALIMYYTIFEKAPFFNILWNEGVYNVLINGDRPSIDCNIADCGEIFNPLFEPMSCAWANHPCDRKTLKELHENICQVHQQECFAIESRILDQMTEKLEAIKETPSELRAKIEKNNEKIAKGEEAMRKKQVELDNALNGKQRKEFTSQIEKGRQRLDDFIVETETLKIDLVALEADIKATKKAVKSQTEKRYGGPDHILRHRSALKEGTVSENLVRKYKGSSCKGDIDDANSSATGAVSVKHAMQSFFFQCGDRSKSLADEKMEFCSSCDGGNEVEFIESELRSLYTFLCSIFDESDLSEDCIPRFAKFKQPGFGMITGVGIARADALYASIPSATNATTASQRDRSDSDLRSERSDKSDIGGNKLTVSSSALSASISASSRKLKSESSVGTVHTEPSEDSFWKFEAVGIRDLKSDEKKESAGITGSNFVDLDTTELKYLAAYRGRAAEAIGLVKSGRGITPSVLAQLKDSGASPAHVAASLGHLEVLINLLEHSCEKDASGLSVTDPSEVIITDTGQTLLHAACTGGCVRTIAYLVETYSHFSPEDSGSLIIGCMP